MKIVTLPAFLALPAGTLFSKYQPCAFEPLQIKGASLYDTNDFLSQPIADAVFCESGEHFTELLEEARLESGSVSLDFDNEGRDGMYDDAQLFAVWEPADVLQLINRLIAAYADTQKAA